MKSRCYYEKNNFSDKKETIVFLHGLTGTSDVWEKYFNYFKKNYNVIRIDLLGHGRSKRPYAFNKYKLSYLALSVLEVLEKENIKETNFVCHSFSFLVSLELYRIRKEMVRSFVFISPYAPNRKRFLCKLSIAASFPVSFFFYFMPVVGKYALNDYSRKPVTKEVDLKRVFWDTFNTGFKSYVGLNFYSLRFDDLDFAKKIDVPVLVMSGENDRIILWDDVKRISDKMRTSTLIKLKNRDHIILYPYFNELVVLIEEFFRNLK